MSGDRLLLLNLRFQEYYGSFRKIKKYALSKINYFISVSKPSDAYDNLLQFDLYLSNAEYYRLSTQIKLLLGEL